MEMALCFLCKCSIYSAKLGQQQFKQHCFLDFVEKVCPWFPEKGKWWAMVEELASTLSSHDRRQQHRAQQWTQVSYDPTQQAIC